MAPLPRSCFTMYSGISQTSRFLLAYNPISRSFSSTTSLLSSTKERKKNQKHKSRDSYIPQESSDVDKRQFPPFHRGIGVRFIKWDDLSSSQRQAMRHEIKPRRMAMGMTEVEAGFQRAFSVIGILAEGLGNVALVLLCLVPAMAFYWGNGKILGSQDGSPSGGLVEDKRKMTLEEELKSAKKA